MSKIAIVSDVNAGLDYLGYDPGIPVLRSVINFGEEHFVDGIDIKATEFYEKLITSPIVPSTSAPTVGEAMDLFDRLIEEGYTDVIMCSISYQLSSIGQMVENLQGEYEGRLNIHVVDTKTAAYLQGFIAVEAKRLVKEGKPVQEILDYCRYLVENGHAYFVVNDLKYLVKNGRLSGAAGFVGSLLKIKPVLELDKLGRIVSKEKIRTHKKAMEVAIGLFMDEIKDAKKVHIIVAHAHEEEKGKELVRYFRQNCPNAVNIELHVVTPAVGAHIGYGVLGFGYYILEK
ncbi:MAG: DegV family protein [Bacilli bacterium]|nr:DegV family protein [Bacilli bacterium]